MSVTCVLDLQEDKEAHGSGLEMPQGTLSLPPAADPPLPFTRAEPAAKPASALDPFPSDIFQV